MGAGAAKQPARPAAPQPLVADDRVLAGGLSDGVRALIGRVKQVRDAFLGEGKPERDRKGQALDRSSSGYDFTFVVQLARHGIRDRSELALALAKRPDGGAATKGGAYLRRTVNNALAAVEREETGDAGDPAEEMDFTVTRTVIYASNPPAYVFTIDGTELRLGVADIHSPGAFSRRFLEALHRIPKLPDSERHPWHAVVNGWLSKAERVEQPPEASSEGALREAVGNALRNLVPCEDVSDLDRGTAVLLQDGRIAFRATRLFEAVREEVADAQRNHFYRLLRELGYVPDLHRIGDQPQRVWIGTQYARAGEGHASE